MIHGILKMVRWESVEGVVRWHTAISTILSELSSRWCRFASCPYSDSLSSWFRPMTMTSSNFSCFTGGSPEVQAFILQRGEVWGENTALGDATADSSCVGEDGAQFRQKGGKYHKVLELFWHSGTEGAYLHVHQSPLVDSEGQRPD